MVSLKLTKWPGVSITIIFLLSIVLFFVVGTQLCMANRNGESKTASVLLQEALYAEEIDGDINAAIKIYQQIIDDSAQENYIAQALYRQGLCYIKLQNETQAQANFKRVVADFSDQTSVIAKVKPLLNDMGNADPAALMPPETLLYVEIGSPGKQIETILNSLKGSPLENPWALIEGNVAVGSQDQMGNIISGLLNESMMAELKKIRGMGIGITGIPQDDAPPAVIVLFPGKSDALRGLLQMVLTMAGKPTQNIEGMNCIEFNEGGGAAYDDSTVILVTPPAYKAGQLEWSVRQYKGIANEPTLASSNKSFAQVSKQARESNALTIWADVNKIYSKLMEILPPDEIPPQMHMVNGIVDFGNIRDLIAFLTLEETGIAVEANISLNEGHNCIAYNMIRTPNLSKESFQAVPSDAIGLLSFALSGADSIQAASVGQQLRNMTGLDFGREIFANIEQVTLFITPPENSPMQDGNQWISIPSNIGLAVTSRNPQQTRQFINQVLTIAGLVSNSTGSNQPEQASGKYLIELNNGMQLHCYQDQSKKISLFSMSPKVIDASLNSISSKKSALTAGPLQKALSAMSPNTSKIFAMNLGSIMSQANISIGSEEDNANLQPLFAQLAEGFNKTTLQLRTNESQNNLNIRYSVDDLPPLGEVFAPMMQIGQIMSQMQQPSGSWGIKASPPAVVARADTPPVIDGKAENLWSKSQKTELNNKLYSAISSDEDLSADYMAMWDKDNLYVFVNVIDDSMKNDSDEHYQDDSIEIFIDADNSKTGEYDDNDYQYYFRWQKENPFAGIYNRGNIQDNIKYKLVTTENGYNLEVMFPWSTFDTKAFPGVKIGLDIHVNDDDDGGDRDSKITWNDSQDSGWENTRAFGTGELAGLIGWWKLDESNGTVVADSSGNGNNGKLIGDAKWQPSGGKTGGAISLDGDGDYIEIANESNFDFAGEVTLSAWIKANQLDKEYQAIVTKGDSAWRIQRNQDQDTLEFACSELQVQNGNQYGSLFGTKTINDGKWHHIAGVYDGEKMYIYMDGIVDVSQSASGAIATNDYPVFIGENAQETSRCWCGIIDDVRVYNYALSEDEILALYNGK